jgi:type I restriction enzyme, R subunit
MGKADYVCRVTADEGQVGRGRLSRFQDIEMQTSAILTQRTNFFNF